MKIQEAKEILVHEIIPNLTPNLVGNFRVTLLGMYRNHAEIGISLVDSAGSTLKKFGTKALKIGEAIAINNYESQVNIHGQSIECFFQARLIGMDEGNTESEIELKLVDRNRDTVIPLGSTQRKQGGTITVNGLDIKLNITPKRVH